MNKFNGTAMAIAIALAAALTATGRLSWGVALILGVAISYAIVKQNAKKGND